MKITTSIISSDNYVEEVMLLKPSAAKKSSDTFNYSTEDVTNCRGSVHSVLTTQVGQQ